MESQYKGPERRKAGRTKTNFPILCNIDPQLKVHLTIKQEIFDAIAKNISEGGMAILTNIELPVNASASVNFTLFNDKEEDISRRTRQIVIDCRTCYHFPVPEGAYQIGLQFLNLSEENRSFIAKYVKDFTGGNAT